MKGNKKGMRLRNKVALKNACLIDAGQLCNPNSCNKCAEMLEGKQVQMRTTDNMGNGLFSDENIKEGDYIVKYTGTVTNEKPDASNEYTLV